LTQIEKRGFGKRILRNVFNPENHGAQENSSFDNPFEKVITLGSSIKVRFQGSRS